MEETNASDTAEDNHFETIQALTVQVLIIVELHYKWVIFLRLYTSLSDILDSRFLINFLQDVETYFSPQIVNTEKL